MHVILFGVAVLGQLKYYLPDDLEKVTTGRGISENNFYLCGGNKFTSNRIAKQTFYAELGCYDETPLPFSGCPSINQLTNDAQVAYRPCLKIKYAR